MIDDLDRPLGMDRGPDRAPPRESGRARLLSGLAALVVIGGAGAYFVARPGAPGGEPEAVVAIQPMPPKAPEPPRPPEPPAAAPAAPGAADTLGNAQQIEIQSGVKIFRGNAEAPGALIIQVPDSAGAHALAPAPDSRLVEKSRYGLLPRRGKDGATPADIYARPLAMQAQIARGAPRVALIVGGMGLNPSATDEAVKTLPSAVSLAFAPYGPDLAAQTAAARAAGHEILLQAPMEPFDSGESPGPHMLRVDDAEKSLDDLHWQMSRFPGFIGLVNFLGGRFTADRAAVQQLMSELAERGLDYVDDGSSPQSQAEEAAADKGVGFAKAAVRLDDSRRPEDIDAALFRLETQARKDGMAIGIASGRPEAVARIARFFNDPQHRNLALVPVSAALRQNRSVRVNR